MEKRWQIVAMVIPSFNFNRGKENEVTRLLSYNKS